jgi:hypothetical protein
VCFPYKYGPKEKIAIHNFDFAKEFFFVTAASQNQHVLRLSVRVAFCMTSLIADLKGRKCPPKIH